MEPQQRLLLEEAWHCIEDSGVSFEKLREKPTSVYIGTVTSHDYLVRATTPNIEIENYAMTGNHQYMLANRISYFLDLKGPSLSVDAACASSLVAIHEAKKSLSTGQSDYALAGGVWLSFDPWFYITLSKAGVISPDGQCKTFDEKANGFVQGEGVGVILMQRLEDALADGNHIWGVIRGSAVNHGGRGQSLTAPRVMAQQDVIASAIQEAGVDPTSISYIESHGTGTYLGDPIEVEALTRTFRMYTEKTQYCFLGSVKTNIGHLVSAAGVAGVIKVLLMMKHKKIPPLLNFKTINPLIPIDSTPFRINTQLVSWNPDCGKTLLAGVSSFGFGGTNSHMIIESPDHDAYKQNKIDGRDESAIFILSAQTPQSLKSLVEYHKSELTEPQGMLRSDRNLSDICSTLMTGRKSFPYRYGFYVKNRHEFFKTLMKGNVGFHTPSPPFPWSFWSGSVLFERIEFSKLQGVWDIYDRSSADSHEKEALKLIMMNRSGIEGDTSSNLLSCILSFLFMEILKNMGVNPEHISGSGTGLPAAMAASGMISIFDALSLLIYTRPQFSLLKRPKIPFFNPIDGRMIMPYRITEQYLSELISERSIGENDLAKYISKARALLKNRPVYKKYIEKWAGISQDIHQIIHEALFEDPAITNREGSFHKKLFILVVLISTLRKIFLKWDMGDHKMIDDDALFELVELLDDQVLSPNELIDLLFKKEPDLISMATSINKRQHLLDPLKSYSILKKQCSDFTEIQDLLTGLKLSSSRQAPFKGKKGGGVVMIGNGPSFENDARVIQNAKLDYPVEIISDTLTRLWLSGVDIQWRKWITEGSFQKVPLPGYPFHGKSVWITDSIQQTLSMNRPDSIIKLFK